MKYERRRLGQPCGFLGPAAGRFSDQAGTASADGALERGASRSFSGSAVVAILFKMQGFKETEMRLSLRKTGQGRFYLDAPSVRIASPTRSEERRVGKECRSRWSPYH